MKIEQGNPIHMIADDGMILTDGETYSTEVWLGKLDSPENWKEVPKPEEESNESEERE